MTNPEELSDEAREELKRHLDEEYGTEADNAGP